MIEKIDRYLFANPPDPRYYDRQATAQTTIPPKPTAEVVRDSMQTVTYVVVIVTCLAVLVTLALAWREYLQVDAALQNLHDTFGS